MNILRKSRKSRIKLDKRRVVLLIFTLIMTTFAWITYSKILLPNLKIHINSWNISIYVDNNQNGVAEESEKVNNNDLINIQPFEIYPGMNQDVMDVIIKNNGETPSEIAYIISDISFLNKTYSIQDDAATYRANNPGSYCLQKNTYEDYGGIVTYKLINEESIIPFEFIIENSGIIDGGAEGYLKVKAVWDATLDDGATQEQIDAKNALDGQWGYDITKHVELADNPTNGITTAPIEFKLKINAIGEPRSSRFVLTQDISPENYGDYVDYSIDLNGDGNTTNDWRIFFEDNENIYLISANYVPNSWLDETIMTKSSKVECTTYGANIDSTKFLNTSIDKSIINKFMLTEAEDTGNIAYDATTSLLSSTYWDQFVDTNVAENAVGAPTIEMFAKSWNQKYNGIDDYTEIICEWNNKKDGYQLSDTPGEEFHLQLEGYNSAPLYFPSHTGDSCDSYWIASPSIREIGESGEDVLGVCVLGIKNDGMITAEGITSGKTSIRPVVCLKSGLKGTSEVNANGDKVWTITQETATE